MLNLQCAPVAKAPGPFVATRPMLAKNKGRHAIAPYWDGTQLVAEKILLVED